MYIINDSNSVIEIERKHIMMYTVLVFFVGLNLGVSIINFLHGSRGIAALNLFAALFGAYAAYIQ